MIQQLFLDSRFADHVYADGTCLHWLGTPIHAKRGTFLNVRVLDAWIPVSFFNVFESNSSITLTYGVSEVKNYNIPHGNRDIDFIVNFLNDNLQYGYVAAYDPARNEVVLSGGTVPIRAGKSELLGFSDGDASGPPVAGVYKMTASNGVNLCRTSSIFLQSNMQCQNRDPVYKTASTILAKMPLVSEQANEILHYASPVSVRLLDSLVFSVSVRLVDDSGRPIDLNGLPWSLTLQFTQETDNDFMDVPRGVAENDPALDAVAAGDSGVEQG